MSKPAAASAAPPAHPTSHLWVGPGEYVGTARVGGHTTGTAATAAPPAPMPITTAVVATAAVPLAVAMAAPSSARTALSNTAAASSSSSAGAAAAAAPSGLLHSVSQSWSASRQRYSSSRVWIPVVVLIPVAIYFVYTLAQKWTTRERSTPTSSSNTTTTHTQHITHNTTHNQHQATTHLTTVVNAATEAAASSTPTRAASDASAATAARNNLPPVDVGRGNMTPISAASAVVTPAVSGAAHVQRTQSAVASSTSSAEARKLRSAPSNTAAQPPLTDSPRTPRASNAAPASAPGSGSARSLRQNTSRAPSRVDTPQTPTTAAAAAASPTLEAPSAASGASSSSPAATPMSKRLSSPRPSAISASRVQQASMRPQFSASLDLPSRSGSRVQSAHQSRSHSPHSAGLSSHHHRTSTPVSASPAQGPMTSSALAFPMPPARTSVSGSPGSSSVVAASGGSSGASSHHPHSVTRAVSMSALGSQYRVHWNDEIKLLGHVHPLKRGVGMAESFGASSAPSSTAATVASSVNSSTADVSASRSPSLNSVSGASASAPISAAAIAARPMGYFNASFDPRSDVILLTGATSFVGVHLLHQMLQESSGADGDSSDDDSYPLRHIVCIVRPASMALSTFDQDSTPVPSPGPDDEADSMPSTPRSRRSAHASTDATSGHGHSGASSKPYAFHFPSSSSPAAQVQWERVRLTFESYGLPWDAARYTRRLVLLPGDCALPHLGLDAFTYHQLVTSTHTIFHVAGESGITARSSSSTPYSALKYSLVESTKRMLELAALQRRKILVFVSSVHVLRCPLSGDAHEERDAILQLTSAMPPHHMSSPSSMSASMSSSFVGSSLASSFTHSNESTALASFSSSHLDTLRNGFLQSKWVCEQLMAQAHERGVPCMVFRLGDVVASRETGRGHHTLDPLGKLLTELTYAGITLPESAGESAGTPGSLDGELGAASSSESSSSLSVPVLPLLPVDEAARCMLFLASCYFQHHPPPPIAPLYAPSSLLTRESLAHAGLASPPKGQLHHHRTNLSMSSNGSAGGSLASTPSAAVSKDKRPAPGSHHHSYSALFSGASAASSASLSAAPLNPSVMPVFHLLHSSVDAAHNKQSGISLSTLLQWCVEYGFDLQPTAGPNDQSDDAAAAASASSASSTSSVLSDFLQTLLSGPARSGVSSSNGNSAPPSLLSPAEVIDFFQCRWASSDGSEPSINDVETRVALREMQERVVADLALEDEMDASNVSHSLILSRKQLSRLTADLDRPNPLDREWMFRLLDDLVRRRVLPPPSLLTPQVEAHRAATDMSAAAFSDAAPLSDDEQVDDDDDDDGPASTLQFSPGVAISPPAKHHRAGAGDDPSSATSTAPPSSSKATPLTSRVAPRAIPSSASSSTAGGSAAVLLPLHATPSSNIFTSPAPTSSYVGSGGAMLVAPTPSAFLSPMPNNGLSFHTPAGSEGVSTPDGKAALNQSLDGSEAALSPSKNLSFDSGDSPMVSASKSAPSASAAAASTLAPTSEQDEDGAATLSNAQAAPVLMGFGSVPSTPPTAKMPPGRKRVPPVPGGRGSQTISSAALRRSNLHEQADGALPVAPRASRAAMGLAALLASPAPQLANGAAAGLVTPAQPQPKAPLFSLESPGSDGLVVPRASSALHPSSSSSASSTPLASKPSAQQETSLMAALNFAANSAYGTPNGAAHTNCNHAASSAASSASSHYLGASLASNRSPAASAALMALTSPMLVRAPSTSAGAGWATCILPNLYLGNAKHAADLAALRAHGITHICNAADDVANFHESLGSGGAGNGGFVYLNLDIKDRGQDEGIARAFLLVEKWVRKAGFVVPREEEIAALTNDTGAASAAASSASTVSATGSRPVRILVHCAKGANRSVTIVLALLMLLYPSWSLDRAHSLLLAARHSSTCPFRDNRTELLAFEIKLRGGVNSMTDKDFRTRIPAE